MGGGWRKARVRAAIAFAAAEFSGDFKAVHNDEGTDGGRMYDVTRNIIFGQNVNISVSGQVLDGGSVFAGLYKRQHGGFVQRGAVSGDFPINLRLRYPKNF